MFTLYFWPQVLRQAFLPKKMELQHWESRGFQYEADLTIARVKDKLFTEHIPRAHSAQDYAQKSMSCDLYPQEAYSPFPFMPLKEIWFPWTNHPYSTPRLHGFLAPPLLKCHSHITQG